MIFFVIAALLVILDQATKFYIRATMAVGATKVLIPNWLGLMCRTPAQPFPPLTSTPQFWQ